jgi:NAD(P)-dependent dehydrogenase (short-subunit alcohol dehydrogenase family)
MQALKNQVILVTGATDGLGRRVASDLSALGATVLLHGRSREKGEATLQEIRLLLTRRSPTALRGDKV